MRGANAGLVRVDIARDSVRGNRRVPRDTDDIPTGPKRLLYDVSGDLRDAARRSGTRVLRSRYRVPQSALTRERHFAYSYAEELRF